MQGELTNLARPGSGHLYFTLKDRDAQVRCAMFRGRNRLLRFNPENGMEVVVRADVSLYEGRGEFQLIVDGMEPAGAGALQQAFEALKQRLFLEGLFAETTKQPLPPYPAVIGLITSPTGAALRDILQVLRRRFPPARVIIYPSAVQGEGAAAQLLAALETAVRRQEVDLLILARGGGSLEDLWSFNDETLARAIHACSIPLISGIGHEIDFTIADFVADLRAPTPSAAAEIAAPDVRDLSAALADMKRRICTAQGRKLDFLQRELRQLEKRLPHPHRWLQNLVQRLDGNAIQMRRLLQMFLMERQAAMRLMQLRIRQMNPLSWIRMQQGNNRGLGRRLAQACSHRLELAERRLQHLEARLLALGPQATLDRGYAIVTRVADDTIVREAARLRQGEQVTARVARGTFQATVSKTGREG